MPQVYDYSFSHPSPWEIVNAGAIGVVRYLGWDFGRGPRCISKIEYDNLTAAGLGVALVWETNADMAMRGAPGGDVDGAEAKRLCELLGHTAPVYVAYDFDLQPGQVPVGDAYQAAFAAHWPQEAYGKYDIIERQGTGWQCAAWSGMGSGSGGSMQGRRLSAHARMYQLLGYVLNGMCDANEVLNTNWLQQGQSAEQPSPTPLPVEQIPWQPDHILEGTLHEVQTDLTLLAQHNNDASLDPHGIDDIWGPNTEAAVRSFQTQTHLAVDGIVGHDTITAMRTLVYLVAAEQAAAQPADQPVPVPQPSYPPFPADKVVVPNAANPFDEDVRLWQERMFTPQDGGRGYTGKADGIYGPKSADAARFLQNQEGLVVDGILGINTWVATFTAPVI